MVVQACSLSYLEGWGRRIAWTQEVKVVVSWDQAAAVTEWDSISKKNLKGKQNGDIIEDVQAEICALEK